MREEGSHLYNFRSAYQKHLGRPGRGLVWKPRLGAPPGYPPPITSPCPADAPKALQQNTQDLSDGPWFRVLQEPAKACPNLSEESRVRKQGRKALLSKANA